MKSDIFHVGAQMFEKKAHHGKRSAFEGNE